MKPLFFTQKEAQSTRKSFGTPNENKLNVSASNVESPSEEVQKSSLGARATDSARVLKFTKVLSGTMVVLGIIISSFPFFFYISNDCFFMLLYILVEVSYLAQPCSHINTLMTQLPLLL